MNGLCDLMNGSNFLKLGKEGTKDTGSYIIPLFQVSSSNVGMSKSTSLMDESSKFVLLFCSPPFV